MSVGQPDGKMQVFVGNDMQQKCLELLVGFLALAAGSIWPMHIFAQELPRKKFHQKIEEVREGMTKEHASVILGQPDNIQMQGKREVWQFGCTELSRLPSLGCVVFDVSGQVAFTRSTLGEAVDSLFENEDKVRRLFDVIHSAPSFSGMEFDPYQMLEVANVIQPLGQKKAFALFREYDHVLLPEENREGIYLLTHCLHETSDAAPVFPKILAGNPFKYSDLKFSLYSTKCPRFPISFLGGIPLLHTIDGYPPSGVAAPMTTHLEHFEERIPWRQEKFVVPEHSIEKLEMLLSGFQDSNNWYLSDVQWKFQLHTEEDFIRMFENQIQRFDAMRKRKNGDSD